MIKEQTNYNRLKMTKRIAIITFLTGLAILSSGQERNEEVTIIAPYQPSITEGNKLATHPVIDPPERERMTFRYDVTDRQIQTTITPEPLNPLRFRGQGKSDLLRNYIRAGIGNYATPYLEFHAGSLQSDDYSFAVNARHRSSGGGIKGYAPSGYSHSGIEVAGEKFFGKHSAGGKLHYDHDVHHFYGYRPDSFPDVNLSKRDIRQRFRTAGGEISLKSNYTRDGKLNHAFRISGYHINDLYENRENGASFKANLSYKEEFFDAGKPQEAGLIVETKYFSLEDSISGGKRGIIRGVPYFEMIFDQYRIKLGVDVTYEFDSSRSTHFYPIAEGEITLVENRLAIEAGIRGRTVVNTFRSFVESNPFLGSPALIRNTYENFTLFAGVKGSASLLNFRAGVETTAFEDLPLFVTDTSSLLQNQFYALYDDGQLFRITGTLSYEQIRNLRISATVRYSAYALDNQERAWHLPSLETSLEARVLVMKKLALTAGVFTASGRYAVARESEGGPAVKLDDVIDLNLGAEYTILPQLSAFLEFRNLANSDYQLWYRYPVQGFQVMAGVAYSF